MTVWKSGVLLRSRREPEMGISTEALDRGYCVVECTGGCTGIAGEVFPYETCTS